MIDQKKLFNENPKRKNVQRKIKNTILDTC